MEERLSIFLKNDFRYEERLEYSMKLHDKLKWSLKAYVDKALEKWMIKQGERCSFSLLKDNRDLLSLQNSAYRWQEIKAKKGKKSGFSSADFTGELEVIDVNRFTKALFEGVGRSKAFGCGLMLVRRI